MTYLNKNSQARAPGRPRDAGREAEILEVVLAVMSELGVEAVTFEEIARRAQASKRTLYRRWATKQEMVVAAIKAGPASGNGPDPIDTGSLREDLLALLARLESTMDAGEPVSLTIMQAGLRDPELCEFIERSAGPTGARLTETVLNGAIARGELPASADPFAYEEVAAATLIIRKLNGLSTDHAYRASLVDAVLIPALQSGVAAGQNGIFSGTPQHSTNEPNEIRKNQ